MTGRESLIFFVSFWRLTTTRPRRLQLGGRRRKQIGAQFGLHFDALFGEKNLWELNNKDLKVNSGYPQIS